METVDQAAGLAHAAADKIAKAGSEAADAIGEKGTQLKATEQRLLENCRSSVRESPFVCLGIAVAAGSVLSRLLNSR